MKSKTSKNRRRRSQSRSSKRGGLIEDSGHRVSSFKNIADFGFPDRYQCKLKYTTVNTLTGTGTTGQKVFRLNSLFDPDLTGVGSQPMCFDQLAAVYQKYLVTAASWEVQYTNLNSTAAAVVTVPSDVSLSGSVFEALCEQKRAKNSVLAINSGGISSVTHRGFIKMSDLHGQPQLDSDDTQYALVSTNPSDVAFLTLEGSDFTTATTIAVGYRIKIIFYCVFKEYALATDSLLRNAKLGSVGRKDTETLVEEFDDLRVEETVEAVPLRASLAPTTRQNSALLARGKNNIRSIH
jgi:hypothetical protein